MSNIRPWVGIVFFVTHLFCLQQTFLSESLENQRRSFWACPSSGLFEVRQNIRLLLNTINEGEGDRVSLIWWKGGRGAIEADEIRESRENVKKSNRIFCRDYCQKTFLELCAIEFICTQRKNGVMKCDWIDIKMGLLRRLKNLKRK